MVMRNWVLKLLTIAILAVSAVIPALVKTNSSLKPVMNLLLDWEAPIRWIT